MGSHHEEPPIELEDVPDEEEISTAEARDDLEQEPDEKVNFTERHPEHFRNPPGHVSELRDDASTRDDD
jgi:hypothetical protein